MRNLGRQMLVAAGVFLLLIFLILRYQEARSTWSDEAKQPAAPAAVALPPPQPVPPPPPPRPNYAVSDGGRYGYESALSEEDKARGTVAKPLTMLAYHGKRNGAHQLMPMSDADTKSVSPRVLITFEWTPGESFLKRSLYQDGKFREKDLVRAAPGALIMAAMQDAERGMLERYVHLAGKTKGGTYVYCEEKAGCSTEPRKATAGP